MAMMLNIRRLEGSGQRPFCLSCPFAISVGQTSTSVGASGLLIQETPPLLAFDASQVCHHLKPKEFTNGLVPGLKAWLQVMCGARSSIALICFKYQSAHSCWPFAQNASHLMFQASEVILVFTHLTDSSASTVTMYSSH